VPGTQYCENGDDIEQVWLIFLEGVDLMIWLDILYYLLSAITGYLIGSFLPGYFLPLWINKTDIRKVGDGNPGVINVNRNAGFSMAFFTCLYDVSKGLLSVFIVHSVFKLPVSFAYLAGVSAVLGHKLPFYLGFKGGRGIAATIGLLLYIFIKILVQYFTWMEIVPFFIYIGIYALLLNLATHGKGDLFTVSIFPFMGVFMLLKLHFSADLVLFLALIIIMAAEAGRNLARDRIRFPGGQAGCWRDIARPFALLFIPLGMVFPRSSLLLMSGCVLIFLFLFDLIRVLIPKVEAFSRKEILGSFRICKEEEEGKISSMTDFSLGLFICFLLFNRDIAFASIGFISLAGFFAALVETNFGTTRIFAKGEKTLEGSLAFLSAAVTVAFFLWSASLLSLHVAMIGALAATLIAMIPRRGDEGLITPLVVGAIMSLL
jgi:glycerol-3-phosphate acyltransferase PlsY